MMLTIEATYENGVFVPLQRPPLADHEKVRLMVETTPVRPSDAEVIGWRRARRIRLDPQLSRQVASAPEFQPDGD